MRFSSAPMTDPMQPQVGCIIRKSLIGHAIIRLQLQPSEVRLHHQFTYNRKACPNGALHRMEMMLHD